MKGYIVGIAGELNSGKDTLASMINYIVAVGTTRATFGEWQSEQLKWDVTNRDRIIHFADPLKDCLSIMYNIPREYFDDRKYKDELWYCIKEKRFIDNQEASSSAYYRATIEDVITWGLHYFVDKESKTTTVIKIRTLMQYFGTEIVRDMMGQDLWTNATLGKAASIAETRRICIIPDMRFKNEWLGVKGNFLYGGDIEIRRESSNKINHSSETIDFRCTYPIQNNGTKMQLFYKALGFVTHMLDR